MLWATAALVVAPLLYVLSAGPSTWLDDRGFLTGGVRYGFVLFYEPLAWLQENGPEWWRSLIDAYVDLWEK